MTGRLLLATIIVNLVGLAGCQEQSDKASPSSSSAAPPRAAITLKLLVIGDPGLAEAVRLLRGEWAERSGGNLVVQEIASVEYKADGLPEVDVVVFPSRQLAELVVEKKLRPVRRSVLESASFAFDDVLPVVRNEVMRFGGDVFAISLGEAPLMLATNRQLADDELAGSVDVGTWPQVAKLAPHASGRPALELIARAASLVDPRLRSELLFDPKDMTPRLTAPHFERALEQMVELRGSDDIANSYKIACPTAGLFEEKPSWQLTPLPRAEETYNSIRDRWEPQTVATPLAVVGFAGRSAGVTTSTRNATSAFKLLAWLTSGSPASRVSSGSGGTTLFRNSQRHQAEKWLGKSGQESAPVILKLLSTGEPYLLARITEIEQYLGLLDESVQRARQGEESVGEILKWASDHWEELTDKLGRDRQRRSYRLHLGLEIWSD